MKAKDYFNKVSKTYMAKISSGLLGKLKAREKQSVLRLLSPYKGCSVLDAGCGPGYYATELKEMGCKVFGVDFSPAMVEEAISRGVHAEVQDIQSMELDQKFDRVLCAGALEFGNDVEAVLKNLKKHLKKDGYLLILYPQFNLFIFAYALYHLMHGVRVRLLMFKRLKRMIEDAGMKITAIEKPNVLSHVIRLTIVGNPDT